MKEKAIVIKTGEILDIENHWLTKKMTLSINMPDDMDIEIREKIENYISEFEIKEVNPKEHKDGHHYILSDGKEYMREDLIIGVDYIREYKLKNIL